MEILAGEAPACLMPPPSNADNILLFDEGEPSMLKKHWPCFKKQASIVLHLGKGRPAFWETRLLLLHQGEEQEKSYKWKVSGVSSFSQSRTDIVM